MTEADKFATYISLFYNVLINPDVINFPKDRVETLNQLCMFISKLDKTFVVSKFSYRNDLNIISLLLIIEDNGNVIETNLGIDLNISKESERVAYYLKCIDKITPETQGNFVLKDLHNMLKTFNDIFLEYVEFCNSLYIQKLK